MSPATLRITTQFPIKTLSCTVAPRSEITRNSQAAETCWGERGRKDQLPVVSTVTSDNQDIRPTTEPGQCVCLCVCVSPWWCGGTRSGPWSRRCRSWSRGWWASARCSARCCCVPATAGSSSRRCESPSSTGWWSARPAAARSPPCGWRRPVCGASAGRSAPRLQGAAQSHSLDSSTDTLKHSNHTQHSPFLVLKTKKHCWIKNDLESQHFNNKQL